MNRTILYRFSAKMLVVFALVSCTDKKPVSPCAQGGAFIMRLENEPGEIRWDTKARKYFLWFSPESKLKFDTKALPCSLDSEFHKEMLVRFEADFYEGKEQWVVNIRHLEKR